MKFDQAAPASSTWDSGVEHVEGSIASDERIKVRSVISSGRVRPVMVHLEEAEAT
jgi:hypothetical protein